MLLMFQPVLCDHKKILSIAERRSRRFMPPLHSRDLSRSERFVPAQLCSNWSSNPDFPAYRLAPAALGRLYTDHRPQPFSLPSGTNRMGPLPPHEPCLLEVFLPREHEKLFHLLSDGKISASRAAGITVSIFVSVLSRCWNHHRRADW